MFLVGWLKKKLISPYFFSFVDGALSDDFLDFHPLLQRLVSLKSKKHLLLLIDEPLLVLSQLEGGNPDEEKKTMALGLMKEFLHQVCALQDLPILKEGRVIVVWTGLLLEIFQKAQTDSRK